MRKIFSLLMIAPLFFVACSDDDDDPVIKQTERNITYTLKVSGDQPLRPAKDLEIIETTGDTFVATIEEGSDGGLIKAMHVGTTVTKFKMSDITYTATINVEANTTLYKDPAQFVGKTADEVEEAYGKPASGSKNQRFYLYKNADTGKNDEIKFLFDQDEIITEVVVLLERKAAPVEGEESVAVGTDKDKLKGHLADRFEKSAETSSTLVYIDAYKKEDAKSEVRLTEAGAEINGVEVEFWRVAYKNR